MKAEFKERVIEKSVSIVQRIAFLMAKNNMNQKDLADAIGVSEPHISNILNYKKTNLGLETIVKFEMVFGKEILVNPMDYEEGLINNPTRLHYLLDIANKEIGKVLTS